MYKDEGIQPWVRGFLRQTLPHVERIAYQVSKESESVTVESSDESGPVSLQNVLKNLLQNFSVQKR